jgi:hypothetical protein
MCWFSVTSAGVTSAFRITLDAILNDPLEEATEDGQAVALADAGQRGVVGPRLEEVVTQVPAQRQAVRDYPHQLSLRAEVLEEHNE